MSVLVFLPVALTAVSCSTYEREWQERLRVDASPDSFQGCWEGTWLSHHNAHTGGLRAIITPLGGDQYEVSYHATYGLLGLPLTFEYSLPVTVSREADGTLLFTGSADLGTMGGGVYEYEGTCRDGHFQSTYKASIDHGIFEMRPAVRPERSPQ